MNVYLDLRFAIMEQILEVYSEMTFIYELSHVAIYILHRYPLDMELRTRRIKCKLLHTISVSAHYLFHQQQLT
jgi:hypothetical protein